MALIPITGVPSSSKAPGYWAEILFAQGASTGGTSAKEIIVAASKLAGGSISVGEIERVEDEATAASLVGLGSEAYQILRVLLQAKAKRINVLGVDPSSGGAPVAATATVTYTGTASATLVGEIVFQGEVIQFGIPNLSDPTAIGDLAEAAFNERANSVGLAATAANVTGTVTITARTVGICGGDGTEPRYSIRASIIGSGTTTVATSGAALGLGTGTVGVDGTTTEAAALNTALGYLDAVDKYWYVVSVSDATALGNLETHLAAKSEPKPGLRCYGFAGYNHTAALAQTLATGRNFERLSIVAQTNGDWAPPQLAAQVCAIVSKRTEGNPVYNFKLYRQSDWLVPGVNAVGDRYTDTEIDDLLDDGVTPIQTDDNGSFLIFPVTTRSKNAAGTVDDSRALYPHRVWGADLFVEQHLTQMNNDYQNLTLQDDPPNADGTINYDATLPDNTLTPSRAITPVKERMDNWVALGWLKQASLPSMKDSIRANVDPLNTTRLEMGYDIEMVDMLYQVTVRAAEVSPG